MDREPIGTGRLPALGGCQGIISSSIGVDLPIPQKTHPGHDVMVAGLAGAMSLRNEIHKLGADCPVVWLVLRKCSGMGLECHMAIRRRQINLGYSCRAGWCDRCDHSANRPNVQEGDGAFDNSVPSHREDGSRLPQYPQRNPGRRWRRARPVRRVRVQFCAISRYSRG
jgi:hypothetical protein